MEMNEEIVRELRGIKSAIYICIIFAYSYIIATFVFYGIIVEIF